MLVRSCAHTSTPRRRLWPWHRPLLPISNHHWAGLVFSRMERQASADATAMTRRRPTVGIPISGQHPQVSGSRVVDLDLERMRDADEENANVSVSGRSCGGGTGIGIAASEWRRRLSVRGSAAEHVAVVAGAARARGFAEIRGEPACR